MHGVPFLLNSNLGNLGKTFQAEALSGEVDLNNIYVQMPHKSMKIIQLAGVTGGTGLPTNYYEYSVVFMIRGVSNSYGMMIMYSLSNPAVMFTRLVVGNGGGWYRTTRTTDA